MPMFAVCEMSCLNIFMFAGEIEIMPGSNPHRRNSRAEKEIETGKEPPPPTEYMEEGSVSQKQGKNKKEAPVRTEKPKNAATLKQQAKPRVEAHGQYGAEPPALSNIDNESVGGKPQDDQQRREQDQKTGGNREEKGNQTQRRVNNENRSPNTSSAAPTGHGSQSLPTHSTSQMNIPPQYGTTQAWSPQTTSAPTSLRQVWDASSHFGTAQQGHGRGIQMNIPPTGGAYSSAQSPQHPSYTQQTNQRSARDRSHGAQNNSQAQAKDRSGTIPIDGLNATGHF